MPVTPINKEEHKIDILKASRLILLKYVFHKNNQNSEFEKNTNRKSLITPVSNFIPFKVKSNTLRGIISDLEIFANGLSDLPKAEINDNMSVDQRTGLQTLKKDPNIVIFTADKGSSMVVLDKDFYIKLMMDKLNQRNKYEILNNFSDYHTILSLERFTRKHSKILTPEESRTITGFDFGSSNIYGVPKIHKSEKIKKSLQKNPGVCLNLPCPSDLTLRVIFGGKSNPIVHMSNLIDILLKPFLILVKARVKDVMEFINRIPRFDPSSLPFVQLWSVDVSDMYASITENLILESISFWLTRYPTVLLKPFTLEFVREALTLLLDSNIGYFNGVPYKQINGMIAGAKYAPTVADLVMGYLETKLFYLLRYNMGIDAALAFWDKYRRYLDDGQIMWDKRLGNFGKVLNLLNTLHPSIRFTSENDDSKLNFLNITIIKSKNNFITEIHQKDTDSDTYLPFLSCHPRHIKINIPFNLAKNVKRLTDNDSTVNQKLSELSNKLERCGYPKGLIKSAVNEAISSSRADLREVREKANEESIIPFVHLHDPSLPDLYTTFKRLTLNLFFTKDLKEIFKDYKIINSVREPPNLGRILQPFKLNTGTSQSLSMISKCQRKNCKSCKEIMEVNTLFFANSGVTFQIKTPMTCLTRNLVYALFCKKCNHSYIGETHDFRERMNHHRWDNNNESAPQEVNQHLRSCGQGFTSCPLYKVKEESRIARLVKEHFLIKLLKPDLNRDERNILHLLDA